MARYKIKKARKVSKARKLGAYAKADTIKGRAMKKRHPGSGYGPKRMPTRTKKRRKR